VAKVQLLADSYRGQGHALGVVLAPVSSRQRLSHGQDKTIGGPQVRGRQNKRFISRVGIGQFPQRVDTISAPALQ